MSIRRTAARITAPLCVLIVSVAVGMAAPACQAAGLSDSPSVSALPATLASTTVLSDTAMAQQVGTGVLAPTPAIHTQSGNHPPMLLWDEWKAGTPATSTGAGAGAVTITVNGLGK